MTGTVYWLRPEYTVPVAIGSIAGLLITPDFDLEGKSITESALYIVPPLAWLWQQLWFGYALLFRHRGFSHNIILGTLGRVAWSLLIALVVMIFSFGLLQLLGITFDPLAAVRGLAGVLLNPIVLVCWWSQDILHYLLDI